MESRCYNNHLNGHPFRSKIISTAEDSRGNLNTRPIPIKTMAQTPVRTLATCVSGLATNTGSQMNVRNKEIKSQIKTHLLGRDVGFKPRQIRPLSKMLIDTATDTNVNDRRKTRRAAETLSTRELCTRFSKLSITGHLRSLTYARSLPLLTLRYRVPGVAVVSEHSVSRILV